MGFENRKPATCNLIMAINKNHEFEDSNGIKCAIVEKNVSKERIADFLKQILEYNHYTVVVVPTPAAKASTAETRSCYELLQLQQMLRQLLNLHPT